MNTLIPPLNTVVERLKVLTEAEICRLSEISSIGLSTIWKIRYGYTKNPGIETVRALVDALPELGKDKLAGLAELNERARKTLPAAGADA